MARKTLGDMSGIANTIARSGATPRETGTRTSAPALGALQGSLAAIREIAPELIDDWGPSDRLDGFTAVNSTDESDGFDVLKESIREGGQQVPILVRRSKTDGRFEVIYGRRRLRACLELGIKVRANVQDLDDANALLAKGLENAARRNLSFYEKARFAQEIHNAGHDTAAVRSVLSLTVSGLSHLTKVTNLVPRSVGDLIGPAPKSGRPKWTELADLFQSKRLSERSALSVLKGLEGFGSDDRLSGLIAETQKREARPTSVAKETSPLEGVTIKTGEKAVSVSVKRTGKNAAFGDWLDTHFSEIIKKSYAEFTAVNGMDEQ
ncbi:MAG: plasmid partitioning protein RepB [Litoreibacter sp.]|nr:plasmid partitioning protein RepB [Litoreibacter sp.]